MENEKLILLKKLVTSLIEVQQDYKFNSEEFKHYQEGQIKAYKLCLKLINYELNIYE